MRGDLHIGGVMIQLVDSLGNNNLNPSELLREISERNAVLLSAKKEGRAATCEVKMS